MEEKPKQNQRQNDKNHKNKKYNNKGKKPQKPAYVPPYTAQELAMPIDVLELNEVTFKVLSDGGVDTIGKIVVRTAQEMYGVQRFNKKNLAELTVRLNAKGFDFKPSPAAVAQPKETENVAKTEPKSEKKEPRAKPEAKEKNKQRQEPQVVKAKPKDEEPSFDKKSVDNGKKEQRQFF